VLRRLFQRNISDENGHDPVSARGSGGGVISGGILNFENSEKFTPQFQFFSVTPLNFLTARV
jgi:hypothetical protein